MNGLSSTLEKYGADVENGLLLFSGNNPELLPYAAIITARNQEAGGLNALNGVYEWQSAPLMFLVNGDEIQGDDHFRLIRRCVALRGDAPYLGVVRPGRLTVHRVSLDTDGQTASQLKLDANEDTRTTFPFLANNRPQISSHRKWISQIVLKLLRDSIRDLRQCNIGGNDAISLAGRALFLRFLGDRGLLPVVLGPPEQLFSDAEQAERSSHWLDVTFNGDFLPLSDDLFASLPQAALHTLGNILYRAPGGQLYLGWQEKWGFLDFAHIPVGVLSEAYEHYMREHDRERQRKEGGFYTPRAIADLMVNASFHALRRDGKSSCAQVLDPAAGAGVFLVSAFRRLVMERWIHDNERPDTARLRDILYNQIVGFDINEAALRFAALGLYLMSIELDPEPEPVEKLRFGKNLRGSVLHNLGNGFDGSLGSLGNDVGPEHVGKYDLVIGNPPWSSSTRLPGWPTVSGIVTGIARERLSQKSATSLLPNEVLDLPFVWRAMEWAKPGGQIAFALHGRLLFQQADGMAQARSALFRAFDVSGVINGAELRQTRVWPEIAAPFCLLFARNELPSVGSGFRFVTPHLEEGLNGSGVMRIDAANAEHVTASQIAERPEFLKVLFRGTILDLEVFDRMTSLKQQTMDEYWRSSFGVLNGKSKQAGNGYQRLRKSSRIRKDGDGLPGVSAVYLADFPELVPEAMESLLIVGDKLKNFDHQRIHDPRHRSLFQKPLLIVHQSPPAEFGRIRVAVSDCDLVYNESYYGYSAYGNKNGADLVRYLALLIGSKPALWYALMACGKFGIEREAVEKNTIDGFPIVPYESLEPAALEQLKPLFDTIVREDTSENWAKVDAWAASLYGLDEQDLQVIDDTLRYNLPFASNKRAAQKTPTRSELSAFCDTLENELAPWAQREGQQIEVQSWKQPIASPWIVFRVCASATAGGEGIPAVEDWPEVLRVADRLASSEVIFPDSATNSLWIARLNQARYWSRSQARLVARRIVWEHLDTLFGSTVE